MRGLVLLLCCPIAAAALLQLQHPNLANCNKIFSSSRGQFCCSPQLLRSASLKCSADKQAAAAHAEPPSMEAVAEMVETTFVRACMDLASGLVDTMKLFIVSVKVAYEQGADFSTLERMLSQCTRQTAGRPLAPDEHDLRRLWGGLVYLTLAELDHPTTHTDLGETVPADTKTKYQTFVRSIIRLREKGATLQNISLDAVLDTEPPSDPIEFAILSQSCRLVFLTMTVLREEALAAGDSAVTTGPQIPGTR